MLFGDGLRRGKRDGIGTTLDMRGIVVAHPIDGELKPWR
jgi:hypothetical protein